MKKNALGFLLVLLFALPLVSVAKKGQPYYQITVYHFATAAQQNTIDSFLQFAWLPAMHKQKVANIGVFTAVGNDTAADKRIYVIHALQSLQQADELPMKLLADADYKLNGASYLDAVYKTPPYSRKEIILLKAFPLTPFMEVPKLKGPKADRIFELRSYESATEAIHQNKVQMFNQGGEIDIFKKLDFNAVFYASVVAGSHMPNLMYVTSYENKTERDAHWKAFGADPAWKTLSALPEYQNNVSKIDIVFMKPTVYSDL